MSQDRKSESGRILKEEVVQKEFCREAMKSLGNTDLGPDEVKPIRAGATKRLRKDDESHSISKAAHERGLTGETED